MNFKNWHCMGWIARLIFALVSAASLVSCTVVGPYNSSAEGSDKVLMLNGHDPVAYFTIGKHTLGKTGITAMHAGATFRFTLPRIVGEDPDEEPDDSRGCR